MDIESIKAFSDTVQDKLPPNISLSWNADLVALAHTTSCTLTAKRIDTQEIILELTYRDPFPDKLNTNKAADEFISFLTSRMQKK